MNSIIVNIIIFVATYIFSVFAFCQILGCVQHWKLMSKGKYFTVLLYIGLLVGSFVLMKSKLSDHLIPYYIALAFSFLQSGKAFFTGEIQ